MAGLMLVNPRKRRSSIKRRKTTSHKRRKSTGLTHHVKRAGAKLRRYRRNPIGGSSSSLTNQVKTAAIGAVGALAVDIAMTKLPLPLNMQTGIMKNAAQGLVSIGIGMLVSKFGKNKSLGQNLAQGGLTIAIHDGMKGMLAGKVPGLAGIQDLSGDLLGMGDLLGDGGYEDYDSTSVGWMSPANVSGMEDESWNY